MTKWYENIARMHNIPLIMIDVPYNNEVTVSDSQVAYIRGQFDEAIKQMEKIAGVKFDEKKFEQACANANRTAKAWLKVCDYLQYKPAPMIVLACVLLYLGIVKQFEPLLLVGIAFGMLLTNLPGAEIFHPALWGTSVNYGDVLHDGGLLDILYIGVKTGLYPSLIFLGVGAMTDFGPMVSKPSTTSTGRPWLSGTVKNRTAPP